jgi:resuscitation-promoting factor RpfA
VKTDIDKKALSVVIGGLGVVAALMFAAPASADPVIPVPPPAPADPAVPAPAPADPAVAAPADPAVPAPAPLDTTAQAAATGLPTPPEGVPHLSSPENLPPGTTDSPADQGQPRSLGYLRDLWHAVQTQEVSGKDALLLLGQRPMSPNAAPPPGMPANPTPPLPPDVAPTP